MTENAKPLATTTYVLVNDDKPDDGGLVLVLAEADAFTKERFAELASAARRRGLRLYNLGDVRRVPAAQMAFALEYLLDHVTDVGTPDEVSRRLLPNGALKVGSVPYGIVRTYGDAHDDDVILAVKTGASMRPSLPVWASAFGVADAVCCACMACTESEAPSRGTVGNWTSPPHAPFQAYVVRGPLVRHSGLIAVEDARPYDAARLQREERAAV